MRVLMSPYVAGASCFACNAAHDPRTLLGVCTACGMPLRIDYDFAGLRLRLADLVGRAPTLWRYREFLPLRDGDEVCARGRVVMVFFDREHGRSVEPSARLRARLEEALARGRAY